MNPFEITIDLLRRIEVTGAERADLDASEGVARAVGILGACAQHDARVMFVGNGASQSIASHMAADLLKNYGLRAMAFTDPSLLTCVGNDLGFSEVFAEPIRVFGQAGDALVAISSSGASPNVIAAVEAGRSREMSVLTVSGFDPDNPLRMLGDINFWVPSHDYGDVEVIHAAILHRVLDELLAGRA